MNAATTHWLILGAIVCATEVLAGPPSDKLGDSRQKNSRVSPTARLTGPAQTLLTAPIAGDPATMTIRLTPMHPYPDGTYNTAGCYDAADITGQTLTIFGGPCRTYWNVFLENWDPDADGSPALRLWQARVEALALSSGTGSPLTGAQQPCAAAADCDIAFGEIGAACGDPTPGLCRFAWVNRTRIDRFDSAMPGPNCPGPTHDVNVANPARPVFFGATAPDDPPNIFCRMGDPGMPVYGGTLALDVPPGAQGTYSIVFLAAETFAFESLPIEIPLMQIVPGVLVIAGPRAGSCCFGIGTPGEGCIDGLAQSECGDDEPGPTTWVPGGICAQIRCCEQLFPCTSVDDCPGEDACTVPACLDGCCDFSLRCPEGSCCADGSICDDENACTADVCESDGCCDFLPRCPPGTQCCADGTTCDDGDFCTEDSCDDVCCLHVLICESNEDCPDDDDPCTAHACISNCFCDTSPLCPDTVCCADGSSCDDLDDCTNDACVQGCCTNDPVCRKDADCDDRDDCTIDSCADGCCLHVRCKADVECDDQNPCTADTCNEGCCRRVGQCGSDAECATGQACVRDQCLNGCCLSAPQCTQDLDCEDRHPCTRDRCMSESGCCKHSAMFPCDCGGKDVDADVNSDGRVDQADYASLLGCFVGPNGLYNAACMRIDLNCSLTIDLTDFAVLQRTFGVGD